MKDFFVSPELYERYKHEVFRLSLAVQRYGPDGYDRSGGCLTDREIAHRLGLTEGEVQEIRCVAEVDLVPLDAYLTSEHFKEATTRRILQVGKHLPRD